jgi:murein DD-endopeptidase MepM/ murein hydrolase activator NlpD
MRATLKNPERLKRIALLALCLVAPIILAGCVTREDAMLETHHDWPLIISVHDGDTVSQIADRYNTSTDAICDENDIAPGSTIYPGEKLRVPGNHEILRSEHRSARVESRPLPPIWPQSHWRSQQYVSNDPIVHSGDDFPVSNSGVHFAAPVGGRLIATFGSYGNGQKNDGINIAAAFGTPVHVSADGVVTYAGNELKGYGNLILVKHANGYVTTYAHVGTIGVRAGQRVSRGDVIATVGQTGDVESPQLHFEIRHDMEPVDPRPLLMASRDS